MKEELIESYFLGTLSESERHEFQLLMELDASFRAEVDYRTDLQKVLISERKNTLRRSFNQLEQSLGEISSKKSNHLWKYAVAASIVVLFGVFGYNSYLNSPTPQDLFSENFVPYRNVIEPIVRYDDGSASNLKTTAFTNYERGNYIEAIRAFKQLYDSSTESYYLFYQANAQLRLGNTNEAVNLLLEHQRIGDEFWGKSQWYLALAYLQQKDLDNCKVLLNKIISKKTYNHEKAAEILKKL